MCSSVNFSTFIMKRCKCLAFLALPCHDGEVRLLRDRVQICKEQIWGYVCKDFWTKWHAKVVCRELGFSAKCNF